jgi:hypothetical protein
MHLPPARNVAAHITHVVAAVPKTRCLQSFSVKHSPLTARSFAVVRVSLVFSRDNKFWWAVASRTRRGFASQCLFLFVFFRLG